MSRMEPRTVATAMVATGLAASMAANVAHGLVSDGGVGAVISGLFWPAGLLLAIEGATRLPWPRTWQWTLFRVAGTSPVAAAAAIVSYLHMSGLLHYWHAPPLIYLIGPIGVDGLTSLGAAGMLVLDRAEAAQLAVPVVEPTATPVVDESAPETTVPELAAGALGDGPDPAPEPLPEPAPVRVSAVARRAAAARQHRRTVTVPAVPDGDLLARIRADIAAQRLDAEPSGNALRTRYGVGPTRASRLLTLLETS